MNTKDLVVYDGKCNFCRFQIKILKLLDFFEKFQFESFHNENIRKKHDDISYEDFMARMYVFTKNNTYSGSEAVKYLSRKLLVLWPFAILLHIPYSSKLWAWLYSIVARNRYIILGRCVDNCSIK